MVLVLVIDDALRGVVVGNFCEQAYNDPGHPDFLLALEERVREFEHEGHQAARDYVRGLLGLSLDKYVCPECVPGE